MDSSEGKMNMKAVRGKKERRTQTLEGGDNFKAKKVSESVYFL